jgi:hypothetical protein
MSDYRIPRQEDASCLNARDIFRNMKLSLLQLLQATLGSEAQDVGFKGMKKPALDAYQEASVVVCRPLVLTLGHSGFRSLYPESNMVDDEHR